jgi:predicted nucleic acid-binding protein
MLVETEDGHAAVADAFRELAESGNRLVTSNYVLVETAALLQHHFGLAAVRDFQQRIVPLLDVVWLTERLHRRAVERLFRTDRRGLSLVDSSSFVVMDAEGITQALALDRDFVDRGYQILPRQ